MDPRLLEYVDEIHSGRRRSFSRALKIVLLHQGLDIYRKNDAVFFWTKHHVTAVLWRRPNHNGRKLRESEENARVGFRSINKCLQDYGSIRNLHSQKRATRMQTIGIRCLLGVASWKPVLLCKGWNVPPSQGSSKPTTIIFHLFCTFFLPI